MNRERLKRMQEEMQRRYRPRLPKRGRRPKSVEAAETDRLDDVTRQRARVLACLLLKKFDTVRVAQILNDVFSGNHGKNLFVNEEKLTEWTVKGQPWA